MNPALGEGKKRIRRCDGRLRGEKAQRHIGRERLERDNKEEGKEKRPHGKKLFPG